MIDASFINIHLRWHYFSCLYKFPLCIISGHKFWWCTFQLFLVSSIQKYLLMILEVFLIQLLVSVTESNLMNTLRERRTQLDDRWYFDKRIPGKKLLFLCLTNFIQKRTNAETSTANVSWWFARHVKNITLPVNKVKRLFYVPQYNDLLLCLIL